MLYILILLASIDVLDGPSIVYVDAIEFNQVIRFNKEKGQYVIQCEQMIAWDFHEEEPVAIDWIYFSEVKSVGYGTPSYPYVIGLPNKIVCCRTLGASITNYDPEQLSRTKHLPRRVLR